ncbi:MAG: hypothetical protein SVW02_03980, partial [Candidatus Nanohaloarchaea archaeon]|nr:hypothetical protein [Candidatus Nanohaloarchaea archaeon]
EYRVVEESNLGYVVPGLSVLGAVLLFLSPLYSQGLARYAMQFISKAAQGTGGVIGGTVAENQAAQAGQLIGQLGAFRAQQVLPTAVASASEFFSGWTFSLIGTAILMAVMAGMLARKYSWVDEVRPRVAAVSFLVALLALSAAMTVMLPGSPFTAFLFAIVIAVLGAGLIALFPPEEDVAVSDRWYLLIPLLWILSTLYGATQKSRIIFLTAQPVALMAGYGLSVGLSEVRRLSVWGEMDVSDTDVDPDRILKAVLVLVLVPVVVFNAAAAYGMAQGVGGSPNQLWMQNLDFMREETPKDSVVLSWWDYGYWFETIGGRAAIADGGNMAFYSSTISNGDRINFPLADFLTAENYTEHMDWLDSLSVDYVVLDSSMIGKYSAVSQIHHRTNKQFNAMETLSCRSQGNRCVTTEANNNTYLIYESRGRRILVPFEQRGGSLEISGTPLMQSRRGTAAIGKVCSEDGVEEIDVGANQSALPGCVAFHPYRQHQTLVYIPQEVVDSTLVELYIMDAHGMEHFDEVFDNGYVKMWKVDYSPNQ